MEQLVYVTIAGTLGSSQSRHRFYIFLNFNCLMSRKGDKFLGVTINIIFF